MSKNLGGVLGHALKAILIGAFKITMVAIAWGFKITGTILTKLGESMEKVVLEWHS